MQRAGMQGPGRWQVTDCSTTRTGNLASTVLGKKLVFQSAVPAPHFWQADAVRPVHTVHASRFLTTVRSPARMPLRLRPYRQWRAGERQGPSQEPAYLPK